MIGTGELAVDHGFLRDFVDMNLTVIDHPLTRHYLTILRSESTRPEAFRWAARSLTYTLLLEATKRLPLEEVEVTTPMETTTGTVEAEVDIG